MTSACRLLFAAALCAATPAAALDRPAPMVNIETRLLEVTGNLTQEVGVGWGPTSNFGGLFAGGAPTGMPALSFDPVTVRAGGGVDLSVLLGNRDFEFLSRPSVVSLNGGATISLARASDTMGMIPNVAGTVYDLVRIDGGPGFNLNGAPFADFSQSRRDQTLSLGAAVITQVTPNLQVRTGVTGQYRGGNEETRLSTENGGVQNTIDSSIEFRGGALVLNVTPTIGIDDRIALNLDLSAGAVVTENDLDVNQMINNVGIRVRDTRTLVAVEGGAGGTIVIGGLLGNNNVTVGIGGRVNYLSDVPFLSTPFRTGQTAGIGRDSRTELLVFITARILFNSD
ncbi:MAG: hypothetical protein H6907_03175 [Hyphomicrobiales bacterium]|nr:hypothetical protein [Hyphomicrobiales bacterium]MCP5370709.1 hypothetical protein [Hyphomicrobiales bacterium]